jgi:hypothetical protein
VLSDDRPVLEESSPVRNHHCLATQAEYSNDRALLVELSGVKPCLAHWALQGASTA